MDEIDFSDVESDALKELINIGVGKAAASLNQILESHIQLEVPELKYLSISDFISNFRDKYLSSTVSSVNMGFQGELEGNASLMFPKNNAYKLVSAMLGSQVEEEEIEALIASTIHEIGNILINSIMGTLGNILDKNVAYTPPVYNESSINSMEFTFRKGHVVLVNTHFSVETLSIYGDIILTFNLSSIENLRKLLANMIRELS